MILSYVFNLLGSVASDTGNSYCLSVLSDESIMDLENT